MQIIHNLTETIVKLAAIRIAFLGIKFHQNQLYGNADRILLILVASFLNDIIRTV